ncbi:PRC and DUF2382 domain-containing protein [Actinomadura sp. PM05-2]|uniref:PRC and DUF2382 domain-containing protein n=2 Tax=Actinomadura parmotrematis TaxID=2864039 RepID=A0ABS7FX51_9ACTN|nr:PRC and DUF2382 domain-containing protein [Actinomadura parmotrematis]
MDLEVTGKDGTKLGTVKQVYLNDASGAPEWITVVTGWFGQRESFVPLAGVDRKGDVLQVSYDKDKIKGAPSIDADQHLDRQEVAELYRYYGLQPDRGAVPNQPNRTPGQGDAGRMQADQGRRAGQQGKAAMLGGQAGQETLRKPGMRDAAGAEDAELVRSEERLRVATERREAGHVRLRRWVETEDVRMSVPVTRERIKVERVPIDGEQATGEFADLVLGEDEREVVLHEERAVVTKDTVAVERVRVSVERVTEEQPVEDQVRKERIEVIPDDGVQLDGDLAERDMKDRAKDQVLKDRDPKGRRS